MGRTSQYIWRYWRRYLFGGLCLFGTATLVMWIPWWIREAVRVIEHGGAMRDVTYYAVLIIAAAVVQGVVRAYPRALFLTPGALSNTICATICSHIFRNCRCPFITTNAPATS